MANSVPQVGKPLPRLVAAARQVLTDRRGGFQVIYAAVLAFILLYVFRSRSGWTERCAARSGSGRAA
jgi:hypothetical protein